MQEKIKNADDMVQHWITIAENDYFAILDTTITRWNFTIDAHPSLQCIGMKK